MTKAIKKSILFHESNVEYSDKFRIHLIIGILYSQVHLLFNWSNWPGCTVLGELQVSHAEIVQKWGNISILILIAQILILENNTPQYVNLASSFSSLLFHFPSLLYFNQKLQDESYPLDLI